MFKKIFQSFKKSRQLKEVSTKLSKPLDPSGCQMIFIEATNLKTPTIVGFLHSVLHQRENLNPKNFVGEEHRQRPGV